MSEPNLYGDLLAEMYDLDKPIGTKIPSSGVSDIPLYLERLKTLEGPILEPAVGTGRMFIPLMEAGLDMTGFDRSAAMLAHLHRHAAARGLSPNVSEATFESFTWERPFAAIILPASSFILIDTPEAGLGVLRRFYEALRPGGLLMLDMPTLRFLTENPDGVRTWTAANGDLLRMESRRIELDLVRQRRVNHDLYTRWREGRLADQVLEVMAYRVWGLQEFELALRQTGFTDVRVTGNYSARAPRSNDSIFTWQALRP